MCRARRIYSRAYDLVTERQHGRLKPNKVDKTAGDDDPAITTHHSNRGIVYSKNRWQLYTLQH
jgi:hypothetical protein